MEHNDKYNNVLAKARIDAVMKTIFDTHGVLSIEELEVLALEVRRRQRVAGGAYLGDVVFQSRTGKYTEEEKELIIEEETKKLKARILWETK